MEVKKKQCRDKDCQNEFKPFRTTDKFCSYICANKNKKVSQKKEFKPIPKKSKKQKVIDSKYSVQRIQFLGKSENQVCFIDGCNNKATTVEHRKGRKGFADQHARDNNIPLTLDERFWAGCCHFHNLELERDPELSKKYQLSKIHDGKKI